ncbi:MAG TPA: hypothetical protein VK636_00435 [Gemmatimonadaceae bacterium]|nr:hypothetical protein [Gemmatimonadaceae bacterium]
MRRLLAAAVVVLSLGCGRDLLDPVMTVDGQWNGLQNGYSVALNMVQTGTDVAGSATIAGVAGIGDGILVGTFVYPDLKVKITIEGLDPVEYTGTMSTSVAKISGKLNGSGFNNLQMDVSKR